MTPPAPLQTYPYLEPEPEPELWEAAPVVHREQLASIAERREGFIGRPPQIMTFPAYTTSAGVEAVALATHAGLILDDWQASILMHMLGERADGTWAAFEVGIVVPRQNGKGAIIEARELAGLFLFGEKLIMHSAHEAKTAFEAFRRILTLIEQTPDLDRRVLRVSRSKGEEGIEVKPPSHLRDRSGSRLRFMARTGGSGRGFSGDVTILDEALGVTSDHMAAIMPTLSARSNPQLIFTTTPPKDATAFLMALRRRGMAGDNRLAYFEYGAGTDGDAVDLDDVELWRAVNPAMGIRIAEEFVHAERRTFVDAPNEFRRERLGVWPRALGEGWQVITAQAWEDAKDPGSKVLDPVAFGVALSHDHEWASIAVAGRRADGLRHVEIAHRAPGTAWVKDWLFAPGDDGLNRVARWNPCAIVVHPGGPAGALIPDLDDAIAKMIPPRKIIKPTERDWAQACGAFYDGVCGVVGPGEEPRVVRDVRHRGQTALTDSARRATKKDLGRAWSWETRVEDDTSPIEAATLAHWGHATRAKGMPLVLEGSLM